METKDLMVSRYEVVDIMPFCGFKKGDILTANPFKGSNWFEVSAGVENIITRKEVEINSICEDEIDQFPHLFHKLEWYEKWPECVLPKYLKDKEIVGLVYKVQGYFMSNCMFETVEDTECHTKYFVPATEQEYADYINQTQCAKG